MYTYMYFGFFKYSPTGSQTALDSRDAQPPVSRYPTGYATETHQNGICNIVLGFIKTRWAPS